MGGPVGPRMPPATAWGGSKLKNLGWASVERLTAMRRRLSQFGDNVVAVWGQRSRLRLAVKQTTPDPGLEVALEA